MQALWAPWRLHYVTQKKTRGCIFCKINQKREDKKNFLIYRSKYTFVVLNMYPYNNGHIMVVPNRHVARLSQLTSRERSDMMEVAVKMQGALDEVLAPQGYNIGMNIGKVSGAGVDQHVHLHIVPRWMGDTNFMSAVSDIKVIVQSLQELQEKLCEKIAGAKKTKKSKF